MTPTASAELGGDLNVFIAKYGTEYVRGFELGHICKFVISAKQLSAGVAALLNANMDPVEDTKTDKAALEGVFRALLECQDLKIQYATTGQYKKLADLQKGQFKWLDEFCVEATARGSHSAMVVNFYTTPHWGLECLAPVRAKYERWQEILNEELLFHKRGCPHRKEAERCLAEYARVLGWTSSTTASTIRNNYHEYDPTEALAKLRWPRASLENRLAVEERRTTFTFPVPPALFNDIRTNPCLSKDCKLRLFYRLREVLRRERDYEVTVGIATSFIPGIGLITGAIYGSRGDHAASCIDTIDALLEHRERMQ